jgi:Bacteriocin-protection, YdeI or OmpD-Associated/Domain of unknown function (DUF1905)
MSRLKFRATIKLNIQNPYILVSKQHAQNLKEDWKKPMPVLMQINGMPEKPLRINLMPKGDGSFYLYLNDAVRKASDTKVGDNVIVLLSFDDTYGKGPLYPMPSWFSIPLSKNKKAEASWNSLPPSRKKEILRYFSWLKSEKTRERNVTRALFVLSGNEGRFMARTWKNGK